MKLVVGTLLLVLCRFEVDARPAGPPLSTQSMSQICTNMMPSHGGTSAQSGNGGYIITTNITRSSSTGYSYTAGKRYQVTLSGSQGFLGFLVIAHVPSQTDMLLGQFTPQNSNQQTLNCDSVGANTQATVAHRNSGRTTFSTMSFIWTAPTDSDGTVDFRYTVVMRFSTFYVRQSAAANDPTPLSTQSPPREMTTDPLALQQTSVEPPPQQTTVPLPPDTETTTTGGTSIAPLAPNREPENYRLTFGSPTNCTRSACAIFVGIDTNSGNSGFLDIYLEGQAGGWLAVGFTKTKDMNLADVVACNRNPNTDMVEALDAWNIQSYGNEIDNVQDVTQFSGSYSDLEIETSDVAKKIAPSSTRQDLDLNDEYFVLYGRKRGDSGAGFLTPHEMGGNNPKISSMINPVTAGGAVQQAAGFPKLPLIRLHGILMIIAWPLLAKCGIFFASWMRPALPKGQWFQVHRVFMLISMFIGAAGFSVAFIANYPSGLLNFSPIGTAHFVIGITVMLLHIVNPIISIFRCKPTGEHRWIFNVFHGSIIGTLAEILAITNVSLGTVIIFGGFSALFFVYLAYCIVNLLVFVVLVLVFTIKYCLSRDPDRKSLAPSLTRTCISSPENEDKKDIALSAAAVNKELTDSEVDMVEDEKPTKVPSKDSPLRWTALVIYLAISTPLLVASIVLVAAL